MTTFPSQFKNPQGANPLQLHLWAQDLVTQLRKGSSPNYYWEPINRYLGVASEIISGNLPAVIQQAAAHGVAPNVTGLLTVSTNPSSAPAGWSAVKIGVQAPSSAGWFSNPTANAFVALYTVVDTQGGRGSQGGIWASNFTAIVSGTGALDSGASCVEFDINNSGTEVEGASDIPLTKLGCSVISGGTTAPTMAFDCDVTSAASSGGTSTGPYFLTGFAIRRVRNKGVWIAQRAGDTANSFAHAGIYDDSNSATGYKIAGGTHAFGIDLSGGTYTTAVFKGRGQLFLSGNAGAVPAPAAGTVAQFCAVDGTATFAEITSFCAASGSQLNFKTAQGVAGTPTAVATNQQLGGFAVFGYGATGYSSVARGKFFWSNAEAGNWTDTAQGTLFRISTTLIGGTATANRFVIDGNGNLQFGLNVSLVTTATDGFIHVPNMAGAPTGAPTAIAGKTPCCFDTTNFKFWGYFAGWKGVVLT